jgi:hypothetical protein
MKSVGSGAKFGVQQLQLVAECLFVLLLLAWHARCSPASNAATTSLHSKQLS